LEVGSYVWNLIQEISKAGWDYFKVLSQSNTSTLVEAMRTIYGSDSDVKMAVDVLEAEIVTFTLVTNKKCKQKNKASSLPSMSFSDFKTRHCLFHRLSLFSKL